MKTCDGYWPDFGTPCRRVLSAGGYCPKAADPAHRYVRQPDDDRWDWVNVGTLADPDQWIKGACKHLTPLPVVTADALDGTKILVAWLCPDCDGQFEPDRFKANPNDVPWTVWDKIPEPNGLELWEHGGLLARARREADPCPCGYTTECAVHCGSGHSTGQCPAPDNRIPEGYRVDTLSRDPYDHLIFVGGGVISRNRPVKDPWIVRFGRAYLDANLAVWNYLKESADWIWIPVLAVIGIVSTIMNGVPK